MFDGSTKKLFASTDALFALVSNLSKKVEQLEKRVTDVQHVRTAVAAAPIYYEQPVTLNIIPNYWQKIHDAAEKAYVRFTPGTKVQHRTLKVEEVFFDGITTLTDVRRIRSMTGSVIPRPHGFPIEGKQGRLIWWMTGSGTVRGSYAHNLTVL